MNIMKKLSTLFKILCVYLFVDFMLSMFPYFLPFHPKLSGPPSSLNMWNINSYCSYVNHVNERMSQAKLSGIITTITLSRPIDVNEYNDYVKRHSFVVDSYEVRWLNGPGPHSRVTGIGGGGSGEPLTLSDLYGGEESMEDDPDSNGELVGIVGLQGYIDSENLKPIMDDPLTFLADTTRDRYSKGLLRPKGAIRNVFLDHKKVITFYPNFAWCLEDNGIEGYEYYLEHLAKTEADAMLSNAQGIEKTDSINVPNEEITTALETEKSFTVYSGIILALSREEVVARSTQVLTGTILGKSEPFLIRSKRGGEMIHTDIYIEPINILRGEVDSERIVVRVQGGKTDDNTIISNAPPDLKDNTEYLLFLEETDYLGDYDTDGKYYYILGSHQGVYERLDGDVYNSRSEGKLDFSDFTKEIAEWNEQYPVDVYSYLKEFPQSVEKNIETGFITEEAGKKDLDEFYRNIESPQYATIVG